MSSAICARCGTTGDESGLFACCPACSGQDQPCPHPALGLSIKGSLISHDARSGLAFTRAVTFECDGCHQEVRITRRERMEGPHGV